MRFGWWFAAAAVLLLLVLWLGILPWWRQYDIEKKEFQAMAWFAAGNYDAAAGACQSLQAEAPGRPYSYVILGNIFLNRGKPQQARQCFQHVVGMSEGYKQVRSEALIGLGRLASAEGDVPKALDFYRRAAQLDPVGGRAAGAQAVLLERQGRYAEALNHYDEALRASPDDAGLQAAANAVRERVAWRRDPEKQARIDRLIQEIVQGVPAAEAVEPAEGEDSWTSKPLTVWLMDLEESGLSQREGHARLLLHLMHNQLVRDRRLKPVERALLEELLAELHLNTSGLTDKQTALKVGRLVTARILLSGKVQYEEGQIQVSMRAIECETGLIQASLVKDFGSGGSVEQMADHIVSQICGRLNALYPLRARVLEAQGDQVKINIGMPQGVRPGQIFKGQIADLTVKVTDVYAGYSLAVVVQGDRGVIRSGLKLEEG